MLEKASWSDAFYATVVIVALLISGASAPMAIIASSVCYIVVSGLRMALASEPLWNAVRSGQQERTLRRYHVLQAQTQRLPPAAPLPALREPQTSPLVTSGRFVPPFKPVDERTKVAAGEWVWSLYGDDERLNPAKVLGPHTKRPGQVNHPKPRQEVLDYLVELEMVRVGDDGMLFYEADHFPTAREALNHVRRGGRMGAVQPHSPRHPPCLIGVE